MSVLRRTVFYDNTNGIKRFWDWALCRTTLGTMAEPFGVNVRRTPATPTIEFDPTDAMARVDDIVEIPIDKHMLVLSGGVAQIHGGIQIPRNGR